MSWECWCPINVFGGTRDDGGIGAVEQPGSRDLCRGCGRERSTAISRQLALRLFVDAVNTLELPAELAPPSPMPAPEPPPTPALAKQVGGQHYKGLAIQPVEYAMANKLGAMEFSVVKYITRWREKGGFQDLDKAKHYIEMLLEWERAEQAKLAKDLGG